MFSKSLSSIVFMALSLSALTAQAVPTRGRQGQEPADCPAPSVIFRTVTVTAGATSTGTASSGNSGKGSTGSNSGNSGKGSTSNGNSGKGSSSNNGNSGNGSSSNNNGNTGKGSSSNNNNGNGNTGSTGNNNAGSGAAVGSGTEAATTSSSAALTSSTGTSGNDAGTGSASDAQTSLTLDPGVICQGFEQDGQANATAGQVPSATSSNNFINHCLLFPNLPLTDGKQIQTGSCNPAPIGVIPSVDNMPSSKFVSPPNFSTLKANTAFTAVLAVNNLDLGHFTNAQANYFAAPQDVNGQGTIIGHTHITIDKLNAIDDTTPTNPKNFAFFKGVNNAAVNGQVSVDLAAGLAEGFYRMCSINTNSNHAPVIVPVAQHGALDDCTYFTVTADGQPIAGSTGATDTASASASATDVASSAVASASATDVVSSAIASASAVDTAVASATVSSAAAGATNIADGTAAANTGNSNKNNNNAKNNNGKVVQDGTAPADATTGNNNAAAGASSAAPVAKATSPSAAAKATAVSGGNATAGAGTGTAASSSSNSNSNNSNNKSNASAGNAAAAAGAGTGTAAANKGNSNDNKSNKGKRRL